MRRAAAALLALLPGAGLAQQPPGPPEPTGFRPHIATEIDLGLIGVGTTSATDRARRGTSFFLDGEVAAALHLTPTFSIQAGIAFEPLGEGDSLGGTPEGGVIGFRRQSAFLETLAARWQPNQDLVLQGGRFVVPFARGHHDLPGILSRVRAHEASALTDALGVTGTYTAFVHPTLGEHDISATAFTLDRTWASQVWASRQRCCDERYERYIRNTPQQGGPSNTGQLDSFALALDGDRFDFLPNFSYHLAAVTRAPGGDGTAREWGYALALRYEYRWSPDQRTLFFGEAVQFRNAGGRPAFSFTLTGLDPDTGEEVQTDVDTTVRERRTFTTLGFQHRFGDWRTTGVWQRQARKRSIDPVPTENALEISIGRDLLPTVSLDVGYQYLRYVQDGVGSLGTAHAILMRLGWRGF